MPPSGQLAQLSAVRELPSPLYCVLRLPPKNWYTISDPVLIAKTEHTSAAGERALTAASWEKLVRRMLQQAIADKHTRAIDNWAALLRPMLLPGVQHEVRLSRERASRAAAEEARRALEADVDYVDDGEAALEAKYEHDAFLHFIGSTHAS